IIGTVQPASTRRFLMSGTAAAASGTLTVQRTISEPASASSTVWRNVDSTSAVSVLVIDCTTTGAPPPTRTCPTFTAYVLRRGCLLTLFSNPSICVNILYNSNVIHPWLEIPLLGLCGLEARRKVDFRAAGSKRCLGDLAHWAVSQLSQPCYNILS